MSARERHPARFDRELVRLGARLRLLRERAGLTLEEAGTPHLTRSGLAKIEAGASSPSFRVLVHLARRLRTSVRELIPDAVAPAPTYWPVRRTSSAKPPDNLRATTACISARRRADPLGALQAQGQRSDTSDDAAVPATRQESGCGATRWPSSPCARGS